LLCPLYVNIADELRDRAVRLTRDVIDGGDSQKSACVRIGGQLEIPPSTLKAWVRKQIRFDTREGLVAPGGIDSMTTRLAELERENSELKRSNAILRAASTFFAAELDRPRKN